MLTSFALIAALAVGAGEEGRTSTISHVPVLTVNVLEGTSSENSETPRPAIVRPATVRPATVRPAIVRPVTDAAADLTNGTTGSHGPVQDPEIMVEDEAACVYDDCGCCYEAFPHNMFRFHPSPHHSPGNMPQHIPYVAEPKNYYYFRPYNWFHIPDHQAEVTLYGGDPRHPYANRLFQEVYEGVSARMGSPANGN